MVEFSRLFPLQSGVLLLDGGVDDVGDDEGRRHGQDLVPDAHQRVGNAFGEHAGERVLLVLGKVESGRPSHRQMVQITKAFVAQNPSHSHLGLDETNMAKWRRSVAS